MKIERVILVCWEHADQLGLLGERLRAAAANADEAPRWIEFRYDAHVDDSWRLTDRLEEGGAEFYVREERAFSSRELEIANAIHVDATHQIDCRTGGDETWDWSEVCDHCMRIPEQVGTLTLAPEQVEGILFARGTRGEFIVHEDVAKTMISEHISGCVLREVHFEEGEDRAPAPYFQVIATEKLPVAVTPPTRFTLSESVCPKCTRGGLFLDSMLYYDIEIDGMSDVNATSELFGEGPALAPEMVLSPRFFELLVNAGAEIGQPEPVMFV